MKRLICLTALLATAAPALANDTQAALTIGGLLFEQNDNVSMESEELYLSADEVRVKYQYRNTGSKPVTLLIAFPLPDMPIDAAADADWPDSQPEESWTDLGMRTLVDGKPTELIRIDIPKVRDTDISFRLKRLGWPVRFWESSSLRNELRSLSADEKTELVSEGILTTDGMADGEVRPAWIVSTSFVRTQTFPVGVPVSVEHRYYPHTGGTVSSMLDPVTRTESPEALDGYVGKYCVDDAFLKAYEAKRYLPDGKERPGQVVAERWLSYALSPGANWKGPIKRFHLIVDKGLAGSLVSLCMDGLKKTGPTRFEVVKADYEPDRDLEVMFVNFTNGEGGY